MRDELLWCKALYKKFEKGSIVNEVLSNITLNVKQGEFVVIMGPSGSGKSTLLHVLSGMDCASSGEIYYLEDNIVGFSEKKLSQLRRKAFGFVFQQDLFLENLSLFDNLKIAHHNEENLSNTKVNQYIHSLLESIDVKARDSALVSEVSGGELQRVAFARAIINHPNILFADEPTGALNRSKSELLLDLFTKQNRSGQTIIMVTHDISVALRADRILYLSDGQLTDTLVLNKYTQQNDEIRMQQLNEWLLKLKW